MSVSNNSVKLKIKSQMILYLSGGGVTFGGGGGGSLTFGGAVTFGV